MRKAFEVEKKYRISTAVLVSLLKKIYKLFGDDGDLILQKDIFLPLDGECSNRRLREEYKDGKTVFLYTRKVRIASNGGDIIRAEEESILTRKEFDSMLAGLNKKRLPAAEKVRREFHGRYGGFKIAICIDDVFTSNRCIGRFVELETIVTQQRLLEPAREALCALACDLGLKTRALEKRGYRSMVMACRTKGR